MKKFLTALLLMLLLTPPAQALPVQEAVQTALTNNPNLQRTEQSIRVAEESLKSARGKKGVSVSASSSVNASKTEGVDVSERASAGLTASLPLYSGGRFSKNARIPSRYHVDFMRPRRSSRACDWLPPWRSTRAHMGESCHSRLQTSSLRKADRCQ